MDFSWEKKIIKQGYKTVAGADEAGRGALAGPIVAAAVIVPFKFFNNPPAWLVAVQDSKVLTPKKRQEIFELAKKQIIWSIGVITNRQIDTKGITWANHQVVFKALGKLKIRPEYLLVDYVAKLPKMFGSIPVQTVVDGDAKILSVALASIMAKVYRDNLMLRYDKKYPGYDWLNNKGYGSRRHLEALRKLSVSPRHRLTYRPVRDCLL